MNATHKQLRRQAGLEWRKKKLNMYSHTMIRANLFLKINIFFKKYLFLFFMMATVSIPSPRATFFLSKTSEWLKSLVILTVVILGPGVLEFFDHCSSYTNYYCITHASFTNHIIQKLGCSETWPTTLPLGEEDLRKTHRDGQCLAISLIR